MNVTVKITKRNPRAVQTLTNVIDVSTTNVAFSVTQRAVDGEEVTVELWSRISKIEITPTRPSEARGDLHQSSD